MANYLIEDRDGVFLKVMVKSRAKANRIVGVEGDYLVVEIAAPHTAGRANTELLKFLRKELGVSQIAIIRGMRSRDKILFLRDADPAKVREAIEKILGESS